MDVLSERSTVGVLERTGVLGREREVVDLSFEPFAIRPLLESVDAALRYEDVGVPVLDRPWMLAEPALSPRVCCFINWLRACLEGSVVLRGNQSSAEPLILSELVFV